MPDDMMKRRKFLKLLLAAGATAAAAGILRLPDGVLAYRMQPGEVLTGLDCPPWAKILMTDRCVIRDSRFKNTSVEIRGFECMLERCELLMDRDFQEFFVNA